jgi:hypothetical protein
MAPRGQTLDPQKTETTLSEQDGRQGVALCGGKVADRSTICLRVILVQRLMIDKVVS